MKFKKFVATTAVMAAALTLAACGKGNQQANSADIVTDLTEETTVTFWHGMNGAQEDALTKLTDEFMAENPKIKVKLQNQSSYPDLQAKINATVQSPKDLPTITQAYPTWLYQLVDENIFVDLKPYMDNEKIGWGDAEPINATLLDGAKINDVQYGMPFNKSTEMLFYNADMLKEYGVDVPKSMDELKEASKTIYEKSKGEVVGAGFDSLSNYYVIGMKEAGDEFTKDLDFTSQTSKDVINYYVDGVKDGYFRIAGSDKYLSGPFANKKVAMFVGSIAGAGFVEKDTAGKFEYGVAPRPTQANLQQGTDIYMFDKATPEEKTAAFLYMKYLATAKSQLAWAQATGYMPIVDSVLHGDEFKKSTGTKVPAQLENTTEELFSIPVEENADAALNETRAIMENILSNTDKDTNKLIESGKAQFEEAWQQ